MKGYGYRMVRNSPSKEETQKELKVASGVKWIFGDSVDQGPETGQVLWLKRAETSMRWSLNDGKEELRKCGLRERTERRWDQSFMVGCFAFVLTLVTLAIESPRQEYCSRLLGPSSGNLPHPGIYPMSLALAGGFLALW